MLKERVLFVVMIVAVATGVFAQEWPPTETTDPIPSLPTTTESTTTTKKPPKIEKMVTLNLYTNENPNEPFKVTENTISSATFLRYRPTQVIIHGWMNTGTDLWVLHMKDKHLMTGQFNVLTVSWDYASWEYSLAANKAKTVGKYIAKILMNLVDARKLELQNLHLIGHCLGAHVAGFVGKEIKKQMNETIPRITGLDPARSLYEFPLVAKLRDRLGRGDAEIVDVIHTCAGRLGFKDAIGDFDFYPNSGKPPQPGCGVFGYYTCSKERAYHLYTESIYSDKFLATPCSTWKRYRKGKCDDEERVIMGLHLNATSEGSPTKYYLRTNDAEPFALG